MSRIDDDSRPLSDKLHPQKTLWSEGKKHLGAHLSKIITKLGWRGCCSETERQWSHPLLKIPVIGAGPQYLTRANHWDPQKRARPLALCHRTTPAPAKVSNDFCQKHAHMIFSLQITKPFEGKIQWIEVESHHLSLTTIHSSFSGIMPIHNGCPGSSNLSTFSIYKYLSSCIRQASASCWVLEFLEEC